MGMAARGLESNCWRRGISGADFGGLSSFFGSVKGFEVVEPGELEDISLSNAAGFPVLGTVCVSVPVGSGLTTRERSKLAGLPDLKGTAGDI